MVLNGMVKHSRFLNNLLSNTIKVFINLNKRLTIFSTIIAVYKIIVGFNAIWTVKELAWAKAEAQYTTNRISWWFLLIQT